MKTVDCIIVGQGLAGSLLAMRLLADGKRVMVIDNAHFGAASHVAAGIINPITGHRLNITSDFAQFALAAKAEYARLNDVLGRNESESFYQTIEQQRLIKNTGQAEYLAKRLNEPAYKEYIESKQRASSDVDTPELVDRGFGVLNIKQSAVVDSKALLTAVAEHLDAQDSRLIEKFDYAELVSAGDTVRYKNITARSVVFCEGYQAIHNPWLKDLPFKLAKGDVLTVRKDTSHPQQTIEQERLLNWGSWLLSNPYDRTEKLGSTYEWNDLDTSIESVCAKANANKLLTSLNENTNGKYQIVAHEVGIRPTTTQRIPFIGALSGLSNAYCFNGFGSKGCLIIPYYAQLMSAHIQSGAPLPKELCQWL